MPTITELSKITALQKQEEEYRQKLKNTHGFNLGGIIVASAVAAMIYPAYKGVFKYLDVLAGNAALVRVPKLVDLAVKHSLELFDTKKYTLDQIATLKSGFKAAIQNTDAVKQTQDIGFFEKVLKDIFGTVDDAAPNNFLLSSIKNNTDLSLSKLLTQAIVPFPAITNTKVLLNAIQGSSGSTLPKSLSSFFSAYLNLGGGRFGSIGFSSFLAYKTASTLLGVKDDNINVFNFAFTARPLMALSGMLMTSGPTQILKSLAKAFPDSIPTLEKIALGVQNAPEVLKSVFYSASTGIFKNWDTDKRHILSTFKDRYTVELGRQLSASDQQTLWVGGALSDLQRVGVKGNSKRSRNFIKDILSQQPAEPGDVYPIIKSINDRIDELKAISSFFTKANGYEEMTIDQFRKLDIDKFAGKINDTTIQTMKEMKRDINGLFKYIERSVTDKDVGKSLIASMKEMPVGPGIFFKSKDLDKTPIFVKSNMKKITDILKLTESATKIPILGFSPVSFAQPTALQSRLYRPFIVKFAKDDILTTTEGALSIKDIRSYISAVPGTNIEPAGTPFAVWQVGSKKYAVEGPFAIDLSMMGLGETEIIRRSEISGAFARTVAEQSGLIKDRALPKSIAKAWGVTHDLPGVNTYNFEETMWSQGLRNLQNVTGTNVIARAMRKIHKGTPLSKRDVAAVFQFTDYVSLQKMDPEFLNDIVGMSNNTLNAALAYSDTFRSIKTVIDDETNQLLPYLTPDDLKLREAISNRLSKELSGTKSTIIAEARAMQKQGASISEVFLNKTLGNTDITFREVLQRMAMMQAMMFTPKKGSLLNIGLEGYLINIQKELANASLPKAGKNIIKAMQGYTNVIRQLDDIEVQGMLGPAFRKKYGILMTLYDSINSNVPAMSKSIVPEKATNFLSWVGQKVQKYQMVSEINKTNIHFSIKNSQRYFSIFTDFDIFKQLKDQSHIATIFGTTPDLSTIMNPLRMLFPKDGKGVSYAGSMLQWIVERPIEGLFEPLGLGRVNPAKTQNAWQVLKESFLKKVLPIAATIEGLSAADAIIKLVNPDKKSPKEAISEIGNKAQLGLLGFAEKLGIPQTMEYMQENLPGLMAAAGAAFSLITGGTERQILLSAMVMSTIENTPRYAHLKRELEGEKNVAVRSGRWWELGRTPYQGGKITHWRQSLPYLNTTGWEYSEEKYGSPLEYLAYANWFPTPFNAFGLNLIIPPASYYWEVKHYADRPYPLTGTSQISNIPFIGKLLSPVSELIKPRLKMHTQEMTTAYLPENLIMPAMPALPGNPAEGYSDASRIVSENIAPYSFPLSDTTSSYATSLAMVRANYISMASDSDKNIYSIYSDRFKELVAAPGFLTGVYNSIEFFKDWAGMSGFMLANYSASGLTDERDTTVQRSLATPDSAFSASTEYYQQYLGSIFGVSELLRRTVQNDYSFYNDTYNPLRNTMPDWLPGSEYFVDLKRGDPYAKMPYGEVRLPGEAYEMTHKLQDNYGPIDRGMILLNVAPWSTQAKASESAFLKMLDEDTSTLSPEQKYKMISAVTEAEAQRKKYEFSNYPFSTPYIDRDIKIEEYLGDGVFKVAGENVSFKSYGIETSKDKIAKHIYESEDITIESAYQKADDEYKNIDDYYKGLVGKTVKASIPEDINQAYRMEDNETYLSGFIPEAIKQAKKESAGSLDKSTDIGKRAVLGTNPVKQAWEQLSHRWGFFQEKFWPQKSAAEEYERYNIYGKYSAQWNKPIQDFLEPILGNLANLNPFEGIIHGGMLGVMTGTTFGPKLLLGAAGAVAGGLTSVLTPEDYVPSDTKSRWEFEEKYDFAQGVRNRYFGDNLPSVAGMADSTSLKAMERNLPRIEREFLQEFVNAPQSEWDKLALHTPEYLNTLVEYARDIKFNEIAGINEKVSFDNAYTQRFEDNISKISNEELQTNPIFNLAFNLEAMKTYEAFYNFDDMSKVYVYDDDVRKAVVSFLQQPIPSFSDSSYYYLMEQMEVMELMKQYGSLQVMPSLNSQITEQRW